MMGWMALWWVGGILLLVAVAWVLLGARVQPSPRATPRDPEDILRERYAKGEIDRETFERMRDDLRA